MTSKGKRNIFRNLEEKTAQIEKKEQQIKEELENDEDLKRRMKKVTKLLRFESYCEALPQAILQAYTLWKRPLACFELFDFNNCKSRFRIGLQSERLYQ